ncbi:DUF4249 family protein [Algoriphagus sp. A40]|uniref:DUF4249 family protein n=1 Tax=Algoriphagus sp. A40 TaxID=1945863 RepID=UPI000986D2B0|nr:DUF4249 family protein [Algoriphagus sp. A40]OOG71895.1 hypothetical protein B0E43_16565 [Algoriphagus sp. A40]
MRKTALFLFIFSFALASCVDEIYLEVPSEKSNLVIDAWLGPTSSQSYVRVYRSAPFLSGSIAPNYVKVPVTRMYVEVESGEKVYFRNSPDSALYYRPETERHFESGKRYRLNVVTDEDEYQSDWSLMPEPSFFDGFEAVAKEKPVYVISGSTLVLVNGASADLNVNITNPSGEEVGYLINTTGVSEVFTTGDAENCVCNCYMDEPLLFSGMNLESSGSGNSPKPVTLAELDVTSLGRFHIWSTIKTISQANLEYLQLINKQQRNTGSIFDPAPFKIKGNIKSVSNPEKEVLGNFMVFQENAFNQMVYRSAIYQQNPALPFAFDATGHVKFNCKEYYPYSLPYTPEPFLP